MATPTNVTTPPTGRPLSDYDTPAGLAEGTLLPALVPRAGAAGKYDNAKVPATLLAVSRAWLDPDLVVRDEDALLVQGWSYYQAGKEYKRIGATLNNAGTGTYRTLAEAVAAAPADWELKAGGAAGDLRDIYDVPQAVRDAVSGGSYTNGELQGTQPSGSQPGQKFTTANYGYEYQRGASGALVWCRYVKG